jgi:REP element-mobilizing transposase RayT
MSDKRLPRNVGQRNLRKGRRSLANQMYHITTVTAARRKFFSDLVAARFVVQALLRLERSGRAATMAFVVMPDHLHWLFRLPEDSEISSTVGSMKSQSSGLINRQLGRSGAVWQTGFHDRALRRDEDIIQIARYIVANPLRAGLVGDIRRYPHWDSIWT